MELNLDKFYDYQSPDSYEKEYAYSVLQSMIDDGELTGKINSRKYRNPDYEYSSEVDDLFGLHEQESLAGTSHSVSSSTDRQPRSSPTEKSLARWSIESDNEQVDRSRPSSTSIRCQASKFTRSRRINNSALCGISGDTGNWASSDDIEPDMLSVCTRSSDLTSDVSSLLEDHQYGSYYITEVSFSAN